MVGCKNFKMTSLKEKIKNIFTRSDKDLPALCRYAIDEETEEICGKCESKELVYGTLESLFQRSDEFNVRPYMEVDNVPSHMKRFYPQLDLSTPVVGCKNCGYCWEDKPKYSFSPDDPELKNGPQEGL